MSAMLRLVAVVGRCAQSDAPSCAELNVTADAARSLAMDAKREYDALQKELRNARRELAELGRNP